MREYAQHLASEVDEVLLAIDGEDPANLEEELGDVFWVIHALILKAGLEHGFTLDDVVSGVVRKFRRRKPHIFSGRRVSREQEIARWFEEKGREKVRAARRRQPRPGRASGVTLRARALAPGGRRAARPGAGPPPGAPARRRRARAAARPAGARSTGAR